MNRAKLAIRLGAALLCAFFRLNALATTDQPDRAVAYQNNPAHTGMLTETGGLEPPLRRIWAVNVGGAASYPLIAENMVFVTAADVGSYGTTLHALARGTGQKVWTKNIGGTYFWSNAAYDRGMIFLVNYDGLLQAFIATTGTPVWTVQLPGQYAFSSPPTAFEGTVYVGGAGDGGTLYAVSESSGALLWSQPVMNGDNSSPAVDGWGVFVSYPCQVYRFTHAGRLVWNYDGGCEGGGGRTPVAYRESLYVRDWAGPDMILDERDGTLEDSLAAVTAPAFWGTTMLYLANGMLQAQSVLTGNQLWSFAGDGGLSTAALAVNGYAYVGSSTGMLYAVKVATGKPVWSMSVGAPIPGPDEQNVSQPLTGFGAGDRTLVVPAGSLVSAFMSK